MNMKKTGIAAALTLGAVLGGAAQQANAYVYAYSHLDINNLQLGAVNLNEAGEATPAGATISTYIQTITNTASSDFAATSFGGADGGTQTCTYITCGTAAYPGVGGFMDASSAQAAGGTTGENNFGQVDPLGTTQYARADSIIESAAVIQIRDKIQAVPPVDPDGSESTNVQLVAESQLIDSTFATSNAVLGSTTVVTIAFTIGGASAANAFSFAFEAITDLLADIDTGADPATRAASSQATANVFVTLQGSAGTEKWIPGAGGCENGIYTCTDTALTPGTSLDNRTASAGVVLGDSPTDADDKSLGVTSYGVLLQGLSSGNYVLTLNSSTFTLITQDPRQVPVPGTLAIFGLGLAGLGLAGRRRRNLKVD